MELSEIISYLATLFLLVSYCCRTVKLRIFQLIGGSLNILFACMILDESKSARSIIVANVIYFTINLVQLYREIKRERNLND